MAVVGLRKAREPGTGSMCCVDVGAMGNGPDDEGGSALETTAARGGRVRASGPPPPVFGRLPADPSPGMKLNVLEKARKDCECADEVEEGARKDWLWSRKE